MIDLRVQGREERRLRKVRIEHLRTIGRTPAKPQYVYCVRTTMIAIPDWLLLHAIPGLISNEDVLWLKSGDQARYLANLDRGAGGSPVVDKFRARKCQVCGLLKIGITAQERARLDEGAWDGRGWPCGPECLIRQKQKRGQI